MKDILNFLLIMVCVSVMIAIMIIGSDHTKAEPVKHPINDELLQKIQQVESGGNPRAVSKKGALGLYQIHPIWLPELKKLGIVKGRQCLFNPKVNEQAAIHILHFYHRKYDGDMRVVLAKYSGGARNYYEKVMGGDK